MSKVKVIQKKKKKRKKKSFGTARTSAQNNHLTVLPQHTIYQLHYWNILN